MSLRRSLRQYPLELEPLGSQGSMVPKDKCEIMSYENDV